MAAEDGRRITEENRSEGMAIGEETSRAPAVFTASINSCCEYSQSHCIQKAGLRAVRTSPDSKATNQGWRLTFTRYCLTSRLLCTNQSTLYSPLPPASLTRLQYYMQHYCAMFDPLSTHRFHAIHHTILCMAISCKG